MKCAFVLLATLCASSVSLAAEPATPAPSGIPDGSPVMFLTFADLAAKEKDWTKAERILRDGMIKHPASDGFHLSLGYVFEQKGQLADAFYEYQWEMLRAGVKKLGDEAARRSGTLLAMESPDVAEPRAVMEALDLGRTKPAAARQKLLAISKKRGSPFALRVYGAELAHLAGDTTTAEKEFRELIKRDPAFVPAYLSLSRLLANSDRKSEADALLAKARSINPDHWSLAPGKR